VNQQECSPEKNIDFYWADIFPIRTSTVLRVAIAEPSIVPVLYSGYWGQNTNMADDAVLIQVLSQAGYNGAELVRLANTPRFKHKLKQKRRASVVCQAIVFSDRTIRENGYVKAASSGLRTRRTLLRI